MTNEAAERLREILFYEGMDTGVLDAALAAERKATVERIRIEVNVLRDRLHSADVGSAEWDALAAVKAILDAEAARGA